MFVSDWMTRKVFTISPEFHISETLKLMRDRKIRHLPILEDDKLRGIISDRDIREFTPSKATSLDVYEMHYLIAATPVKKLMVSKVITASPDDPVEAAAMMMFDNNVGCLPVMLEGRLTGIISDRDIYRVLVDITGARHGGHRITVKTEDRAGSLKELVDIIRKHDFNILGLLTSYEKAPRGYRYVAIRCQGKGSFAALKAELTGVYKGVIFS